MSASALRRQSAIYPRHEIILTDRGCHFTLRNFGRSPSADQPRKAVAATRQSRHQRADRHLQNSGRFGIGQVFDRHEQDCGTLIGR